MERAILLSRVGVFLEQARNCDLKFDLYFKRGRFGEFYSRITVCSQIVSGSTVFENAKDSPFVNRCFLDAACSGRERRRFSH